MNETGLKNKVIKYLRREYPEMWIYKTSDRFTAGIPDLIICHKGRMVAIELKVGRNKPTRLQSNTLHQIQTAGGQTAVCWDLDGVKEFLKGR